MIIELPTGIKVDTESIQRMEFGDLYKAVQEGFAEYTSGTNPKYMYEDKLMFIDLMAAKLHHADPGEKVNRLIKKTFSQRLDEYGEFMDESEFLSIEFMEDCYQLGKGDAKLYLRNLSGNLHTDEAIMMIECIVIKAVMDYTGGEQ